jgi:hypothetical protein
VASRPEEGISRAAGGGYLEISRKSLRLSQLRVRIFGFWAEIAEFDVCSRKIRLPKFAAAANLRESRFPLMSSTDQPIAYCLSPIAVQANRGLSSHL